MDLALVPELRGKIRCALTAKTFNDEKADVFSTTIVAAFPIAALITSNAVPHRFQFPGHDGIRMGLTTLVIMSSVG